MGVYCFEISPHEVQHAVIPTHIVTTTDLVQIHAPSSPNKCIHPRSTHTHLESKCENGSSENRNHFQRRNSRRSRTRMSQARNPLRATYTCAAVTCESPCSLGPSHRAAARFGARTTRMQDIVGVETISQRRASPQSERRVSRGTQHLSGMTLASREISTFCDRWSDPLGSARSLSLATAASNWSCTCTIPSARAELQTPCMHQCVHLAGHPAIADDRCQADYL